MIEVNNSKKQICEEISKGNFELYKSYLANDVVWNILANDPIIGKEQVLEVLKMSQLESFPAITIKTVVEEGNIVVIESTGIATTKKGNPYNQIYCDVYNFKDGKIIEFTTYLDTTVSNTVNNV